MEVSEEFGQVRIVLVNPGGGRRIFELARQEGVQVRVYMPDKISLEDIYISSVKGAV